MSIKDRFDEHAPNACRRCGTTTLKPYGGGHLVCPECDYVQPRRLLGAPGGSMGGSSLATVQSPSEDVSRSLEGEGDTSSRAEVDSAQAVDS